MIKKLFVVTLSSHNCLLLLSCTRFSLVFVFGRESEGSLGSEDREVSVLG